MSVNQSPKKEENQSAIGWQPYILWFAISIAVALLILPLLPGLIANLIYSYHSFGGKASKIYWYLSRASGFVSFTILWISMALGLGITNKMARLWPGAPSAFAVHQYTSMLGLAFAAYHGLVLIGDHFVDFSLPRLLTPFSIAYETNWVGLGQMCFYIWLVVVLSFYARQKIGQKTWRLIHYVNFAVYIMGFLHGLRSGTDSDSISIRLYYLFSGLSLLALLAYRIYDSHLKKIKISLPKFHRPYIQELMDTASKVQTQPAISTRVKNLPRALLRAQMKKPVISKESKRVLESAYVQATSEAQVQTVASETVEQQVKKGAVAEGQTPPMAPENIPASVETVNESVVKETSKGPIVKLEGTSQEKKIGVRIFTEPTTRPIPELQESDEIKFPEDITLLVKIKNRFRGIPVETATPYRQAKRVVFSED